MSFADKLRALSQRAPSLLDHLKTEEATKTALVLPFIAALGYDVFDPTEVVPEYTADVGIKKGEKVDYAIRKDGELVILFECKAAGMKLSIDHASQLYRYFSVTKARIAVLTNGTEYQFFSDLEEPNKLDTRPFLVLDLTALRDELIAEASAMTKSAFDLDEMLSTANTLKYLREIRQMLEADLEEPSEELVRLFHSRVTKARFVQSAREQFTPLVKRAFAQLVSDRVNERLRNALAHESAPAPAMPSGSGQEGAEAPTGEAPSDIETTPEELEGFQIVRAIVCKVLPPERVVHRDAKTYFAILVDDNNRKPLARLWFNSAQKYVGLLDDDKKEIRHPISSPAEIFQFADALLATASRYADSAQVDTDK